MSRTYEGELPATMAILGLVIQRPDETVSKIASLFVERFEYARFSRSTVYNTLPRLAEDGKAHRTHVARPGEKPSAGDRYKATERGVDVFRGWVRDFAISPTPMRDAFYCKMEFAELGDLPPMIEGLQRELEMCKKEFVASRARVLGCEVADSDPGDLRAEVRAAILYDQSVIWGIRIKRAERLRRRLREIRAKHEGPAGGNGG